ncbi:MAG: RNA 2',3'-cyclic phosphodiesterase [Armatimonadota bacterium]
MTFVRTFVAVLLADELKTRIAEVQRQAKELAPSVKWIEPENFHITLKFLGNVREDALSGIFNAVDQVAGRFPNFELSIAGLGAFPNPRSARVVWVGVKQGREELAKLAGAIDTALTKLGFPKEAREFKSHITIGRVKNAKHLGSLAQKFDEIDATNVGRQIVSSVAVMKSTLKPEGAVYSPLRIVELSRT